MTETAVIYSNGSQECHFDEQAFYKEFGEEATYPQVAYGAQHIGSMKETLHYLCAEGII
jgi:hypothetical protein